MEVKKGSTPVGDDTKGKAANGMPCDDIKDKNGCADGLRCQLTPDEGKHTCIKKDNCNTGKDATKITCGSKTLAASILAALAIASTI